MGIVDKLSKIIGPGMSIGKCVFVLEGGRERGTALRKRDRHYILTLTLDPTIFLQSDNV
jgi:hypothetical protein